MADRGFFAYNVFAHAIENNAYFLIRVKDQNMKRLTGCEVLPDLLDNDITRILSRSKNKKKHKRPELEDSHRYICKSVRFDYLPPEDIYDEYTVNLRVLRFKITEDSYENIVTNLPGNEFSSEDMKQLYHRRWGIETSFCKLKHVIGTGNFHSKKRGYITQEIWARLILYNYGRTMIRCRDSDRNEILRYDSAAVDTIKYCLW
ncbi:transposase [Mediterraneibacter agrestimuris]|uniref:transposase n=1 Tax=Mediterraneibacter agrestimuris TaxID=2941333 RepID=UPI002F3ECF3A